MPWTENFELPECSAQMLLLVRPLPCSQTQTKGQWMMVSWGLKKEGDGGRTQEIETKIIIMWMMMNEYRGIRLCGG